MPRSSSARAPKRRWWQRLSRGTPAGAGKDPREILKAEIRKRLENTLGPGNRNKLPQQLPELRQLLDIAERVAPEKKRFNLVTLGSITAALLLTAIAASVPMRSTEVELSARVSGFDVAFAEDARVLEPTEVVSLTVHGAGVIETLDSQGRTVLVDSSADPYLPLSIDAAPPGPGSSTARLSVNPIDVPVSTRVALSTSADRNVSLAFSHSSRELEIKADIHGTVRLGWKSPGAGSQYHTVRLEAPAPVFAWRSFRQSGSAVGSTDVLMEQLFRAEIKDARKSGCVVCLPTGVSELRFQDEVRDNHHGLPRTLPISSILSGSVVLRELDNREVPLRPRAPLSLEIQSGKLRSAFMDEQGVLNVVFEGEVSSLTLGTGSGAREMKPSVLEWLGFNKKLQLLWVSVVFLAGKLLLAARTYWGQP